MQNVNNTKIKTVTTLENADNSVQLEINLQDAGYAVNGHAVESVTLYADADCIGDLAVNWAYEESDNAGYVESGMLLMRNNNSEDNITETMGEFYWEHCFDEQLKQILLAAGFSATAVGDVCTSEWGMQDEGRASYDANLIGEEMLACYNLQYEDA
jgi:hypothetical protein